MQVLASAGEAAMQRAMTTAAIEAEVIARIEDLRTVKLVRTLREDRDERYASRAS
jgi:hypothetical protein